MKKVQLFFITVFSLLAFNSFAQNAYEQGKSYASLGYGYQLKTARGLAYVTLRRGRRSGCGGGMLEEEICNNTYT